MKPFFLIVSFFTSCVLFNSCSYIICNQYEKKHKEVWDACVQGIPTKNDIKRTFTPHSVPLTAILKKIRWYDNRYEKVKLTKCLPCWINKTPWLGMKNIQYGYYIALDGYNYNYFGMLIKDTMSPDFVILLNGKEEKEHFFSLSYSYPNDNVGRLGTQTTSCHDIRRYYDVMINKVDTNRYRNLAFDGLGGDTREYYTKKVEKELGWK